jgi:hypothetical protein
VERTAWTGPHASRLFARLQATQAEIAFLHLGILTELRNTKRARHRTGFAADALALIHHDDTVFLTLCDRFLRADLNAGWVRTVHAGK